MVLIDLTARAGASSGPGPVCLVWMPGRWPLLTATTSIVANWCSPSPTGRALNATSSPSPHWTAPGPPRLRHGNPTRPLGVPRTPDGGHFAVLSGGVAVGSGILTSWNLRGPQPMAALLSSPSPPFRMEERAGKRRCHPSSSPAKTQGAESGVQGLNQKRSQRTAPQHQRCCAI